jgi:hypothetical protein
VWLEKQAGEQCRSMSDGPDCRCRPVTASALPLVGVSLGEHLLRRQLEATEQIIRNQVNKPTNRLPMRWIFQGFEGKDTLAWQQAPPQDRKRQINMSEN